MAKRAYGIEDKKARRQDILAAAQHLFISGSGDLPAVATIAATAGLAKGTFYLYYRTKEEVYADLLLDGWTTVLRELAENLENGHDSVQKVSSFLTGFTAYLDLHPELLRLDALGHWIERKLEPEKRHAFKSSLNDRLAAGGSMMEHALGLPKDRGVQLLMRTYALTRGLWLAFGDNADAAGDHPSLFQTEFRNELAQALNEYLRGALGTRL